MLTLKARIKTRKFYSESETKEMKWDGTRRTRPDLSANLHIKEEGVLKQWGRWGIMHFSAFLSHQAQSEDEKMYKTHRQSIALLLLQSADLLFICTPSQLLGWERNLKRTGLEPIWNIPLINDNQKRDKGKQREVTNIREETRLFRTFTGAKGETDPVETTPWERKRQTDMTEWTREGEEDAERERRRAKDLDNWQRVEAAFTTRQAAQLELKAPLRHNEDVAAN